MENAIKALLIAAGVFLVLMIISLLVATYRDISSYYEIKHEATVIEQNTKFNAKFENYHRNNIRGSELISLMNRIIDYNASESYVEEKNYKRIKVTITLGGDNILEQFKVGEDDVTSRNKYLNKDTISNTNTQGTKWQNDRELTNITNTSTDMCAKLQLVLNKCGITTKVTDNELKLLASNASVIVLNSEAETDAESNVYNRFKRAQILEDVLGIKIGNPQEQDCIVTIDEYTGITKRDDKDVINSIKEITSQYYQYMQFKRAYFDCTEVIYDTVTKRVVEMNFKLQVKDGSVVFN